MHWRFVEAATDEFANLLRRAFSLHEEFNNVGATGIFNLGIDDEGLVFDQFFQEYEQYPVIAIAGQGGSLIDESGGGISGEFGQESIYQDVANVIDVTQYLAIGTTDNLAAGTSLDLPELSAAINLNKPIKAMTIVENANLDEVDGVLKATEEARVLIRNANRVFGMGGLQ